MEVNIKKKRILAIILILMIVINIYGCGNKGKTQKSNKVPVSDLFGEITVWSQKNDLKSLQKAGEDFKKINPKVQINFVEIEESGLYEKISSSLASGIEFPDIFSIKNSNISRVVNRFPDGFLDVTAEVNSMKGNLNMNQISECKVNGDIFAFPWQSFPVALFYRTDIFSNANVDTDDIKSWQDFIEAGKKILENSNGSIKMLPRYTDDDLLFSEMLNQLRSGYFNENGKPILNSDEFFTAMSTIKKMNDTGIILNCSQPDAVIDAIKNGAIATLPYGSDYIDIIKSNAPELKGKWGIMKLPTFEPGGNSDVSNEGTSIMITKASRNKKVATEFAKFAVTDRDSLQDSFNRFELFPVYAPFFNNKVLDKRDEYFNNAKIFKLLRDVSTASAYNHFTENYLDIKKNVIDTQSSVLSGNEDIQFKLDKLQIYILNKYYK